MVAIVILGRFENESLSRKAGMVEIAAEGFLSNIAFADVLMTVEAGGEGGFGVVEVDDGEEGGGEGGDGGGEIDAGGEGVGGVEAEGGGQRDGGGGAVADFEELVKGSAEGVALPGGDFPEEGEAGGGKVVGGGSDACLEEGDSGAGGLPFGGAGVGDEEIGVEGNGAEELGAHGGNGFFADGSIGGGEVDEVAVVDDEGLDVEPKAGGAEGVDLSGIKRGGAPGAGAGGENLNGVGADVARLVEGVEEGAGDGDVGTEAAFHWTFQQMSLGSVISSMAYLGPSRPEPESLTPP